MKSFIFYLLCLFVVDLYPQSTYITIIGTVKDKQTEKSLPYVNIYLEHSHIGTVTNSHGEYVLHIKTAHLPDALKFSYIGYDDTTCLINSKQTHWVVDVKLQQKTNKIGTVEITAKRPNPVEILKKTYDFNLAHQSKAYKIDFYSRLYFKYNDTFIYGARGIFKGYVGDNLPTNNRIGSDLGLWNRCKLVSLTIKTNDSLLYTHSIPEVGSYMSLVTTNPLKRIRRLLKKGTAKIDTVIFYKNTKLYVIEDYYYHFTKSFPSNYDLIVNTDMAKTIFGFMDAHTKLSSYKFYIEVSGNKYILKKWERVKVFHDLKNFNFRLLKQEHYYKVLEDSSIIPTYQTSFEYYMSDTAQYYTYDDYVITTFTMDTAKILDNTYKIINESVPVYSKYLTEKGNKKYKTRVVAKMKEVIDNNPSFNYIKQDTLEDIINRDLKWK